MSKKSKEQFYSSDAVVKAMVTAVRQEIPRCDIYIDPSAGQGQLFRAFPRQSLKFGFDIDPPVNRYGSKPRGIVKKCFAAAQLDIQREIANFRDAHSGLEPIICVASNPPFRLLTSWFQMIADYSDWVMWLAPAQNSRLAFQDWVPANFILHWQSVIQDSVFIEHGEEKLLPTVLQIWRKTGKPILIQPIENIQSRTMKINWRFESWNNFRNAENYKLCFCRKTGAIFIITSVSLSTQYCNVIDHATEDGEISKKRLPFSVSSLIVCESRLAQQQLLKLNSIISTLAPLPFCTRPTFKKSELIWLWHRQYQNKYWLAWSRRIKSKINPNVHMTPLDKHLFA